MASKKSVRKTSGRKPLKSKTTSKKKPAAKKGKTKPSSKPTATKKKSKDAKPSKKKKTSSKASSTKKKVVAKKSVSKKKKATPKKKVVKAVSKAKVKKSTKKKPVVQTKKIPVSKKKVKSSQTKKPITKSATPATTTALPLPKTKEPVLSSTERYNIGGLFACAIERRHDPDFSRLRAVLRHLGLSSQEKDNFIRLSEGFMIPKLFAENLPEQKVNQLLTDLVKFAIVEGNYEKYWREEIQQIGFWLGIFPVQFQAIEQQVRR